MKREEIIRDVARTLFVCAWAYGVESGEIEGEKAGAGEDWMDAAPSEGDPSAEIEARRIVDAFDEHATLIAFLSVEKKMTSPIKHAPSPIEQASAIHAELSGGDRFAHCLAMVALGHGVGLDDDCYPGKMPGWVRASVVSSDYGPHNLDPERYPAPLTDGERFVAAVARELEGCEAFSVGACPGCGECGLSDADPDDETARQCAEEGGFSRSSCDSCSSSLGGNRYPAHWIYRADGAPAGDLGKIQHCDVCADCLMYHANGEVPETWE